MISTARNGWTALAIMIDLIKQDSATQGLTDENSSNNRAVFERCLRGDAHAWEQLVNQYARLVHSVPVRHGLAPDEVEDVAQDVFLALAKSLHQIENPDALPGWLMTTARRLSWRAVQKGRREAPVEDDALSAFAESRSTDAHVTQMPTIAQLQHGWERQEILAQGFQRLGERCRDLLSMLFLQPAEPSYDEISQVLGISKGSIGPTRTRCLEKLREILAGFGTTRFD